MWFLILAYLIGLYLVALLKLFVYLIVGVIWLCSMLVRPFTNRSANR